jgi:hypothetical protein
MIEAEAAMNESGTETTVVISARCEQRLYPPYDDLHGTPNAMLRRKVTIETPRGSAAFEQTDYGHPGRLNPWEPRGVASSLTPKLAQLQAVAEAMAALQDAGSR